MDFTIGTEELQRIVKLFGVTIRANALDGTGRILIEANDKGVEFVANNNSTAMSYFSYDSKVKSTGVTSITYSKIKSFVSSFKPWDGTSGAKNFRFKKSEKTTSIFVDNIYENGRASKGKLRLTNYNPALVTRPEPFGTANFSLNSTIFRLATNKVLYAIDPNTDSAIPALQGMNVNFDDEHIYFAGSDGCVLSEFRVKNTSDRTEGNLTLGYDFIMGLRRLLNDDIQLLWEIKGNRVAVKTDNLVFSGRLIIGHDYPEYQPVLDKYTDHININKEVLMGFLTPFLDVLNPDDNFRLTFQIKDKVVTVSNDQANVEVEQDIAGGLDFVIDVNGKLMMQSVETIKDDHVLMKFSDEASPIIFDSSTFEDQKSLITPLTRR
jgi:DNA polymerase III sliding clamp (beta) subunit (PCNA family)